MYEQIARNKRRTVAYIALFFVVWVGIGALVGWLWSEVSTSTDGAASPVTVDITTGAVLAALLALFGIAFSLKSGDKLVLRVSGAQAADRARYPQLYDIVEALAIGEGIPTPEVYVIDDASPNAFATGTSPKRASITTTTGLLAIMNREELEGVIGHEMSHIKNYDVRLLLIVSTLIGMAGLLASLIWRSALFMRGGRGRNGGQVMLIVFAAGLLMGIVALIFGPVVRLALSRRRESLADVSGVELTRNPAGLISALRKLQTSDQPFAKFNHATAAMCIDDPLQHHETWFHHLFDTHPPIAERIATLEQISVGTAAAKRAFTIESRNAVTIREAGAKPTIDLTASAAKTTEEALASLATCDAGLSDLEATRRLGQFGANVLRVHEVRPWAVLVAQLRNPLLLLLLVAAGVSGITGDPTDAVIITVIVALSVGLSFINEYRAQIAVEALHASIHHRSEVWRDGRQREVEATELVPGDVVSLRIGEIVPADIRLLEVNQLECDESVLTGESMPVEKSTAPIANPSGTDLPGCAFMGTIVHEGSARGLVVQTGTGTAFGRIAAGLSERPTRTAFETGLSNFSKFLFGVAIALTAAIFIINVSLSRPLIEALLFSLAIAVGITPEMMPAIVTVSLSSGARELAKKKVLVKRLVAIEDIGNIDILFTDKTGTLTEGVVTFQSAVGPDGMPDRQPLVLGLVCNEATPSDEGPTGGNALDQALWRADDAKLASNGPEGASTYRRRGVLPFDHERQMATVLAVDGTGRQMLVTKGAPEAVLSRCTSLPGRAQETLDDLFAEGARVIAVATREMLNAPSGPAVGDEQDLTLSGYLVFSDRPKLDAGASIAKLRRLGIDVKIITGDNGVVAAKVCKDIGLESLGILSGSDLDALDDEQLTDAIERTTIFARTNPDQKSRIIKVARKTGKDVAFLGDGVNDAVALHHADVGISVDSGTDVAKDAADIVLLDKDLGVLADGVMEGRRIFTNTMKYVLMATSSNFGNMFSAAGASIFLKFLPMLPSQILLNNLLYNTGQLVIPTDNVDPEALAKPTAWDIGFIRRFMSVFGPVSSVFDFLTFWIMLSLLHAGAAKFRTGWFVESIATQTLVIYAIRTRRVPFFRSRPSAPMLIVPISAAVVGAILPFTPLAKLLGFTPLPFLFFLVLVGMIATYLLLVEIAKTFFYRAPRTEQLPRSEAERLERRIRRRAARFASHVAPRFPTAR